VERRFSAVFAGLTNFSRLAMIIEMTIANPNMNAF
jgi:hypothetical protein